MPREPFFKSHAKCVDVFVHLLNKGNGLNNWFVLPVYIGSTLLSGESVTKTELGSLNIVIFNLLHDLDEVSLDSSLEFRDGLVEGGGDSSLLENPI